jgi:hypothetical protein
MNKLQIMLDKLLNHKQRRPYEMVKVISENSKRSLPVAYP